MAQLTRKDYQEGRVALIDAALAEQQATERNTRDLQSAALLQLARDARHGFQMLIDAPPVDGDKGEAMRDEYIHNVRSTLIMELNQTIKGLREGQAIWGDDKWGYVMAYREFLQAVESAFYEFKTKQMDTSYRRSLYTVSYDITRGKTRMFTNFSDISAPECPLLCCVLLPSDQNAWDVHRYLPMLTHEASHNFRYIKTRKMRNKSVVDYLMKKFSRTIVRELLAMLLESENQMYFESDVEILSDSIADAMIGELNKQQSDLLENGRLDHIISAIYSLFSEKEERRSELLGKFAVPVHPHDIIRKSVLDMISAAEMYYPFGDDVIRDDAGLTLDTLIGDEGQSLSPDLVMKAVYELTAACLDRLRRKSLGWYEEIRGRDSHWGKGEDEWVTFLETVSHGRKEFEEAVLAHIPDNTGDQRIYSRLVEQMMAMNEDLEIVRYVCKLYDGNMIPGKSQETESNGGQEMGRLVYGALKESVFRVMNTPGLSLQKMRFTSEKAHAVLIRLGLFEGEGRNGGKTFLSYYKRLFHHWDRKVVVGHLDEALKAYREIYADLGMCAVFGFNETGYRCFMERNSIQMREYTAREIMRDRVDTVSRILSDDEDVIIGNYDACYRDIYELYLKMNMPKGNENEVAWLAKLRNLPVVKAIRDYYNNGMSGLDEEKKTVGEAFKESFYGRYKKRSVKFEEDKEQDPVALMMESMDHE